MKTTDTLKTDRRGFFKRLAGVGVVGAGAVALAKAGAREAVPEAGAVPEAPKASGYRETEHIRRYYETARF